MIPEFLPFRFQGVRRVDEVLANPKDFGWKCRKYIKWREVHSSEASAKALYSFAETLIDKGCLLLSLYGEVCSVCLNVQKWRIDKETLSVEPPRRKGWEKRSILFSAARVNPALIATHLADRGLAPNEFDGLVMQIIFFASEIDTFLREQNIKSYPTEPLLTRLLHVSSTELAALLHEYFSFAYKEVELIAPKELEALQFLERVLRDLGFEDVTITATLTISSHSVRGISEAPLEMVALHKFTLIEVAITSGITRIRLNKNHKFVRAITENGILPPHFEAFFKNYAKCMVRMGGSIDTLETFNAYLGMELSTDTIL